MAFLYQGFIGFLVLTIYSEDFLHFVKVHKMYHFDMDQIRGKNKFWHKFILLL